MKRHNLGCCCLRDYGELEHECHCHCIQLRSTPKVQVYRPAEGGGVLRVWDTTQGKLCAICIDGILKDGALPCSSGSAHEARWWDLPAEVAEDSPVVARFIRYLETPGCTPKRHAWWEEGLLATAQQDAKLAQDVADQAAARLPGWSIIGGAP